MKLVDVHCHINDKQFETDFGQVIERAKAAGVVCIITNAIEPSTFDQILSLPEKESIIKVALGVYPDNVCTLSDSEITSALDKIKSQKDEIVAIGEIGLDYKYTTDKDLQEKQRKYFIAQLRLAKKINKPVIIHSRDAEEDVLQILADEKQKDVVLHCFCGNEAQVDFVKEKGWYFSIPVRAKSSKHFQMMITKMPLSNLLTETDAPYLHYKQERNEPANVAITIEIMAKLKGMAKEEVANVILSNYLHLFSRK